jgi:hypothetical protein
VRPASAAVKNAMSKRKPSHADIRAHGPRSRPRADRAPHRQHAFVGGLIADVLEGLAGAGEAGAAAAEAGEGSALENLMAAHMLSGEHKRKKRRDESDEDEEEN